MNRRTGGHDKDRETSTEQMLREQEGKADRGSEPGQSPTPRRAPGRPLSGKPPSRAGSVRLEPALRVQAAQQAAAEGVTVSEVIRRALRAYLRSA